MSIGRLCAIAILGISVSAAAQPTTRDAVGCWETYGHPRDSRSFCVGADGSVRLVTHAYEGGGTCASYPAARARVTGNTLSFDVPRGRRNCELADKSITDSVGGRFNCEILNSARIACHVTWEGWEPTTELYRRKQDRQS